MATGGVGLESVVRSSGSVTSSGQNRHKINQVCRYFLHGACNKGESCMFLHDKSRAVPSDNICKFYLAGNCSYGDKCRYDHVKSKNLPEERSSKSGNKAKSTISSSSSSLSSGMVVLKKGGVQKSIKEASDKQKKEEYEKKWVEAKEFVPGQRFVGSVPGSYAQAVEPELSGAVGGFDPEAASYYPYTPDDSYDSSNYPPQKEITEDDLLCPYFANGHCPYEPECQYVHGEVCDMCGMAVLHPKNKTQRDLHIKECMDEHEREMEAAFIAKESGEKECGICLEVIKDKAVESGKPTDRRFGILENCNHCFCLPCIKEWRKNRIAEKSTHRACPICRTHSNFVTPSEHWVEEPDKKNKLIDDYKSQLSTKPCQYFKQGRGECPFYDKCFYKHALPDGSLAPAKPRPRRRRVEDGETSALMEDYSLWDYLALRDASEALLDLDDELSLILMEAFQTDDAHLYFTDSDSETD